MTIRRGLLESRPEVEQEARLPQTPDEMKAWFRQRLAALRSPLGGAFERLTSCYAAGIGAADVRHNFTWEADRWGCPHYQRQMWWRADRRRREMFAELEPQAALILRAMDDALAELTVLLIGRADTIRAGPEIVKGQHLATVLHAVGNYLRHAQEWRNIWLSCGSFTPRQIASIRPLTHTVVDGAAAMSDDDAYDAFLRVPMPLLSILDRATGYDDATGVGSYDLLERAVAEAADAIVDTCWSRYDPVRRSALASRRADIEARALIRERLSRIAFAEFVALADEVMREHLFTEIDVQHRLFDPEDARWSNGICYVKMLKGDGFAAHIWYGPLDGTWGEFNGPDEHFETCEIDPASAREVGVWILADWLNSDSFNDLGWPVYRGEDADLVPSSP